MAVALLGDVAPRVALLVAPPMGAVAIILVVGRRGPWAELLVAIAFGLYVGARAAEVPPLPAGVAGLVDQAVADGDVPPPPVLEGWVSSAPEASSRGDRQGARLRLRVDTVGGAALVRPSSVTIGLSVANGVPPVLPGDRVRVAARLRSIRGLANPGVPDPTLAARAAGLDLFAGVGAANTVRAVPPDGRRVPAPLLALRAAARARQALGAAIDRAVTGPGGVFLHTAVLGERRATDETVEAGFRAAGATHVLSVSGLHLAAIALVFVGGLRLSFEAVPRLPLVLSPRAVAAAVAIPAIVFYTLVTGAAVATVRSALMLVFVLVGVTIGRRGTGTSTIAATVVALLAWSPLVVADVSFQLSVVSVVALAWLTPALLGDAAEPERAADARWWARGLRWFRRWSWRMGAASLAAGLTTAPVVAHYFGEVAPAAPLGNLVLVPLVELVVVPFGLAGAALGAAGADIIAMPILTVAAGAARLALALAEFFRRHAPLWLTRAPGPFETAGLSLGFACALCGWRRGVRHRRLLAGIACVALASAFGSLGVHELRRRFDQNLVVTFLDVGQGDAAVLQVPGGHTVLVDGGGTYDGSFDPGERVIEPFLRAHGIVRLDLVALSHPHPDHQGGLHRVLRRFPVAALYTSGDDGRNPDYHLLMREARVAQVPTPIPVAWRRGAFTLEPLGPFTSDHPDGRDERIGPTAGVSVNDASLVLRAAFGGRAVLFTGDIEADGEGELCGRASVGQTVASDVLKVPHHGSRTSSSDELLAAVRPRLAVMSLGWRNRFRFPRPEVVERYRSARIGMLRTDLHGAVTVTITPEGRITTACARGCM